MAQRHTHPPSSAWGKSPIYMLIAVVVFAVILTVVWSRSLTNNFGRHHNFQQSAAAENALMHGNYSEARRLFEIGANQGDPREQYLLALMESSGTGGLTNREGAIEWMKKSAANGYAPAKQWLVEHNRKSP